jgi:aspartate ammonia-lyase
VIGVPERTERDLLGPRTLLASTRYGVHTLRALENFPRLGPTVGDVAELSRAFGMVKLAALRANVACGVLAGPFAEALEAACSELAERRGDLHASLVVPLLQGGAGTSTNMNVNEVLANRALELLGQPHGSYGICHPNDHVNRSQSTNDVYPTALRVALLLHHAAVGESLERLVHQLGRLKGRAGKVPKLARTQLQDAVPMTVGQEVLAWADRCRRALDELDGAAVGLREVNLGGTAVGTGLSAPEGFAALAVRELAAISALPMRAADHLVSATTDSSALLRYSSALRSAAVALNKVCNDLRLLGSGPRAGLAEYRLPAVQAGSSMMPGKVNPVICEYVNVVAFRIHGLDTTATLALDAGQLQLNAMLPAAAQALLESQQLLAVAADTLASRCIAGLEIDESVLAGIAGEGLGEVTELAATMGYGAAAELAARARRAGIAPKDVIETAEPSIGDVA